MLDELRKKAAELLESGKVNLVIGYGKAAMGGRYKPVFITDAGTIGLLEFDDEGCEHNLAAYLNKPEIKKLFPVAVVVKSPGAKAVNVMFLENRISRENVVLLGIKTESEGDPSFALDESAGDALFVAGDSAKDPAEIDFSEVEELEKKSIAERWEYWRAEFSKCIRCYACRQSCPICACERCITDKNQPQWLTTSIHEQGNYHWQITRAFHLAGRCVDCGECERACPVGIPLSKLNRAIAKEIKERYGFVAGMSPEEPAPLATYKEEDEQDFIG